MDLFILAAACTASTCVMLLIAHMLTLHHRAQEFKRNRHTIQCTLRVMEIGIQMIDRYTDRRYRETDAYASRPSHAG